MKLAKQINKLIDDNTKGPLPYCIASQVSDIAYWDSYGGYGTDLFHLKRRAEMIVCMARIMKESSDWFHSQHKALELWITLVGLPRGNERLRLAGNDPEKLRELAIYIAEMRIPTSFDVAKYVADFAATILASHIMLSANDSVALRERDKFYSAALYDIKRYANPGQGED